MDSHRSSLGRRGSRCWDIERSGSGRFIERFIGFGRVAYGRNDFAFNADGFGFCDLLAFNIDGFGLCDLFVFFQFVYVIQPAASVKSAPSVPASPWERLSGSQASWPKLPLLARHRDPCRIQFLSALWLPRSGCGLVKD